MGEALLMDALISEYGLHRPALTGGPLGIITVTPWPHEILIRVAPRQIPRWAATVLRTAPAGAQAANPRAAQGRRRRAAAEMSLADRADPRRPCGSRNRCHKVIV